MLKFLLYTYDDVADNYQFFRGSFYEAKKALKTFARQSDYLDLGSPVKVKAELYGGFPLDFPEESILHEIGEFEPCLEMEVCL